MENEKILKDLYALRDAVQNYRRLLAISGGNDRELAYIKVVDLYGKVAYYYKIVTGDLAVKAVNRRTRQIDIYPNFFEAGFLSSEKDHFIEGVNELTKVIGIIETAGLRVEEDQNKTSTILARFRPCCNYIRTPIDTEENVQDIIWIMLRSNFTKVEREETLRKFGLKSYRPDFGIPDLKILIEVKFINDKTNPKTIQEEILADVEGYLNKNEEYTSLIVFIYDKANKIRDPEPFISDLKRLKYISDVIIVPKTD